MPNSKDSYSRPSDTPSFAVREDTIEYGFIGTLQGLKYEYREDIRDRAALEKNFREKFKALNRVRLTDAEFARLLDEIVTPDVFTAARTLRSINAFTAGSRPMRWPTTCASRATASPPNQQLTSPSCCTASTSSRTRA